MKILIKMNFTWELKYEKFLILSLKKKIREINLNEIFWTLLLQIALFTQYMILFQASRINRFVELVVKVRSNLILFVSFFQKFPLNSAKYALEN